MLPGAVVLILLGGGCDDDGGASRAWLEDRSLASADARIVGEAEGDALGLSATCPGDVDGDGFPEVFVGVPGLDEAGEDAGGVVGFRGPVQGEVLLDDAWYRLLGEEPEDEAGTVLAAAGDLDGDGTPDLAVGAQREHHGTGAIYLVTDLSAGTRSLSDAQARIRGELEGDLAGADIAGGGDLDGDGAADLLVGAPRADSDEPLSGAAYRVHGPVTGRLTLSEAGVEISGENVDDEAGTSVAMAGDVNGDGLSDALVGAPRHESEGVDGGAAYLLLGPATGVSLEDADARYVGIEAGDLLGWEVSSAGDVDGDGLSDVILGAVGANGTGGAWLLYGPVTDKNRLVAGEVWLEGEAEGDHAGAVLAAGGDLDHDDFGDVLMGAPDRTGALEGEDLEGAGAVYVFLGPLQGTVAAAAADAVVYGESADAHAGVSLAPAADVDHDLDDDFWTGAYAASASDPESGVLYLLEGGAF